MLGAFAEFERGMIRERQREGIALAKAKGKHLGRKAKVDAEAAAVIRGRVAGGEPVAAVAAEYGVSRQTVYSLCGKEGN